MALLLPSPLLLAADPTQPPSQALSTAPGQSAPTAEALHLQAILLGPDRRHAVINGQLLREGQRIAGARVVAIGARSVSIERQGKRSTLHLLPPLQSPSRNTP